MPHDLLDIEEEPTGHGIEWLYQSEHWQDRDGKIHLISDMEPQYRANVMGFLQRWVVANHRAVALSILYQGFMALMFLNGEMAQMSVEQDMDANLHQLDANPIDWIIQTPLYQALKGSPVPLTRWEV